MNNYFFYLWKISNAALFSIWGVAAVIMLLVAFYYVFTLRRSHALFSTLISFISLMVGIYTSEYNITENLEAQRQIINEVGLEYCGTGLSNPTSKSRGISNPCEYGCFRGATIRKIVTMGEFPPWPKFQKEVECWRRTGPWEVN